MAEQRELVENGPRGTIYDKGYVGQLLKKWEPLLEGVGKGHTRNVMAVLCENQAQALKQLDEDTTSSNVGAFVKFVFPILRRVWPNLIANDIVSVQPMTAPVGAIFYYELKYGSTKGSVTAGDLLVRNFNPNYSSEYIDGETIGTGNGSTTTFNATLQYTPVLGSTVCVLVSPGVAVEGAGTVSGVTLNNQCAPTITNSPDNDNLPNVGGEYSQGSDNDNELVGPITGSLNTKGTSVASDNGAGVIAGTGITGTINYTTGAISVVFGSAPASGVVIAIQYQYNLEANSLVPQVNIDIQLSEVRARTRKLKALWSSEAADDLKAFHGIDAEAELVAGIAAEIALEIDREIINDLTIFNTGFSGTFSNVQPAGITQRDYLATLITVISQGSNQIHKNSLRGPANFLVTSPNISSLIEQLTVHADFRPLWAPVTSDAYGPAESPQTFGIYKLGTLQSKWVVYKDPFFPYNKILMGYKGGTFIDAGYVWAPYVPLQVTATFLDPNDFTFRKGLRTRYAKKITRPEFYGNIVVGNITP